MKKIISLILCMSLFVGLLQLQIFAGIEVSASAITQAKISSDLNNKLNTVSASESVPVAMWLTEFPLGDFEQQAWKTVSSEYGLSASASLFDKTLSSSLSKQQLDEVIQAYIEAKRDLVKQAYTKYNLSIVRSLGLEDKVIRVSQYAPFICLNMTQKEAIAASKLTDVQTMEIYVDAKVSVSEENLFSSTATLSTDGTDVSQNAIFLNVDDAYTEYGLTGSGVKIGISDTGIPRQSESAFDNINITVDPNGSTNDHGTHVTAICTELAPGADYFCTGSPSSDWFDNTEWLIEQGVNIINMSISIGDDKGTYNYISKYFDRMSAFCDILFVIAAGNRKTADPNRNIYSSSMGYNSIAVANYDHNSTITNTTDLPNHYSDDEIFLYLALYNPADVTDIAYKPDICAPGKYVTAAGMTSSGTSLSAPHVTAIAALLLEQDPLLKLSPVSTKSILLAGVNKASSHYYTPATYSMDVEDEDGNPTGTYRLYGAGLVDAYNACEIAYSDNSNYRNAIMQPSETYHDYSVYFSPSDGEVRIVLTFERNDKVIQEEDEDGNIVDVLMDPDLHNLDLEIYTPSGTLIYSSTTTNNNVEIVDFTPPTAGVYKIRVRKLTTQYIDTEFTIAWSKTNT